MHIKKKLILVLCILTMFFLTVNYSIQRLVIFPSFLFLEESEAKQNLERATEAILREIDHIDILCHDWAAWDDTYDFVISKSEKYIESNLKVDSFVSNRINFLYINDAQGSNIWKGVYDLKSLEDIDVGNILNDPAVKEFLLKIPDNGRELSEISRKGIINTGHGTLMLASRPILTSNNQGPPRGTMIMGRFLDQNFVKLLIAQTNVDFTVTPLHEKRRLKQYSTILSKLTEKAPYYLERIDRERLVVYSMVIDIVRNPALLISTTFPREISKRGMTNINFAIIYILIMGAIIMALFLFLVNFMILNPLYQLTSLIRKVEDTGDITIRSSIARQDELGVLSNGFNKMMERIEAQTGELTQALNEQQREIKKRREAEDQLKQANLRLGQMANIDPLTGIANRRHFSKVLEQEWHRMKREKTALSVVLCDVDFFKLYNDTYGHQRGDECLKSVARVIKENAARSSDFAARFGGEEFIVLLPNTEPEGALYIANKMVKAVQDLNMEHSASTVSMFVTISIGVAGAVPSDQNNAEEIIQLADEALYASKEQGRNRAMLAQTKPS